MQCRWHQYTSVTQEPVAISKHKSLRHSYSNCHILMQPSCTETLVPKSHHGSDGYSPTCNTMLPAKQHDLCTSTSLRRPEQCRHASTEFACFERPALSETKPDGTQYAGYLLRAYIAKDRSLPCHTKFGWPMLALSLFHIFPRGSTLRGA